MGTSIEQGSDDGTVDLSAKLLAALHMVGDLERKIENFRKSSRIFGSVEQTNQLFSKADVQMAELTAKISNYRNKPSGSGSKKALVLVPSLPLSSSSSLELLGSPR